MHSANNYKELRHNNKKMLMHTSSSLSLGDVQSHQTDCLQTLQYISDLHTSPLID